MLSWIAIRLRGLETKICFLCEHKTRIELKTISSRKITVKGVKPYGKVQWKFKSTYLYGVILKMGEHLFYEFTHLNSQCFQISLELIAEKLADSMHDYTVR